VLPILFCFVESGQRKLPLNPPPNPLLIGQIAVAEFAFEIGFFGVDDGVVEDDCAERGQQGYPELVGRRPDR